MVCLVEAVNDGYSDRCSRTSRTARSRRAGSTFLGMTYILPPHKDAASNLVRFNLSFSIPQRVSQLGNRYQYCESESKTKDILLSTRGSSVRNAGSSRRHGVKFVVKLMF